MTTMTTVRTVVAVLAVPAFVLVQGYRDVRARLLEGDVTIDVANQITMVGVSSTGWLEALLGVLIGGALVAVVAPRRGQSLSGAVPLLTATALLAVVLVVGMAVTVPLTVGDWALDLGLYARWSSWVLTALHGPAVPALLGVLLVLCARVVRGARDDRLERSPSIAARALVSVVAVPVLVLAQGYLDVRAEAAANGVLLDASTTQTRGVAEASPTWLAAVVTVVLAGTLVALVLPRRTGTTTRLLPLLVAAVFLATVVVIGQSLVEPPLLVTYVEAGGPQPVRYWLQTGTLSPVVPLLLGVLLVLGVRAGWTARAHTRLRGSQTR